MLLTVLYIYGVYSLVMGICCVGAWFMSGEENTLP